VARDPRTGQERSIFPFAAGDELIRRTSSDALVCSVSDKED
jgi:hypothetical protein